MTLTPDSILSFPAQRLIVALEVLLLSCYGSDYNSNISKIKKKLYYRCLVGSLFVYRTRAYSHNIGILVPFQHPQNLAVKMGCAKTAWNETEDSKLGWRALGWGRPGQGGVG